MVYLREITKDNIKIINMWRNDNNIVDFLGAPFRYINIETDLEWFDSYQRNRNSQVRCAIIDKSNNNIVGSTGLIGINPVARSAEFYIMIVRYLRKTKVLEQKPPG